MSALHNAWIAFKKSSKSVIEITLFEDFLLQTVNSVILKTVNWSTSVMQGLSVINNM